MPNQFTHLYGIARSAFVARQFELETLGDNMANINTPAFKEHRATFQAALDVQGEDAQRRGVHLSSTTRDFTQGTTEMTGQNWDLAIDGPGFFAVQMQDGQTAYTRLGAFQVDSQRQVVDGRGNRLSPGIAVPADIDNVSIDPGGMVTCTRNGIPQQLGQIQITRFANPQGLHDGEDGLYLAAPEAGAMTTGAPTTNGLGHIVAQALEMSNVNAPQLMTSLLRVQRCYAMTARALQVTDQMAAVTNQITS